MKLGVFVAAAAAAGLATALLLRRKQSRPVPPPSSKPASVYHEGRRVGFSIFLQLPAQELLGPRSMGMHQEVTLDSDQTSLDFVRESYEPKAEKDEEVELIAVHEKEEEEEGHVKILVQEEEERDLDGESALLITSTVEVEQGVQGHADVSEVEVKEVVVQAGEGEAKVLVREEFDESTSESMASTEVVVGVEEKVNVPEVEVEDVMAAKVLVQEEKANVPEVKVEVEVEEVVQEEKEGEADDESFSEIMAAVQYEDTKSEVPPQHGYDVVDQINGECVEGTRSIEASFIYFGSTQTPLNPNRQRPPYTLDKTRNNVFAAPAPIANQPCLVTKPRTVSNAVAILPKGPSELQAGQFPCPLKPSHVSSMLFGLIPTPIFQDPQAGPLFPQVYVSHKKSVVQPSTSAGYLNQNFAVSTNIPGGKENRCDVSGASQKIMGSSFKPQVSKQLVSSRQHYCHTYGRASQCGGGTSRMVAIGSSKTKQIWVAKSSGGTATTS